MTPEELKEIKERAEKATMGNWVVEDYRQQSKDWRSTGIIWAKTEENYYSPGKKICSVSCSNLHAGSDPIEIAEFEANSTFIAHARTDIPKLIEALEKSIEVIQFYGDKSNWDFTWHSEDEENEGECGDKICFDDVETKEDNSEWIAGRKAREFLKDFDK